MPRQITTVNTSTDTFQIFIDRTNEVINLVGTVVLTTNTGNGDITSGNGFVNGFFGANTLVTSVLRAGNVSNSSANLVINSNVFMNATSISVGNSTVNSTLNSVSFSVNAISSNTLTLVNFLSLGNSTVNVVANSTTLKLANSTTSITIANPNTAQVSGGSFYLNANGQWSQVDIGVGSVGGANSTVQYNDSSALGGSAGFTFNETTNNVSIANTLNVARVYLNESHVLSSSAITAGLTQQQVDSFSTSTYRAAEYLITVKNDNANAYQVSKLLLVQDSGGSYVTEYGIVVSNTAAGVLGTFASDVNTGNVRLLFTPNVANTTMKILRTTMAV